MSDSAYAGAPVTETSGTTHHFIRASSSACKIHFNPSTSLPSSVDNPAPPTMSTMIPFSGEAREHMEIFLSRIPFGKEVHGAIVPECFDPVPDVNSRGGRDLPPGGWRAVFSFVVTDGECGWDRGSEMEDGGALLRAGCALGRVAERRCRAWEVDVSLGFRVGGGS